MIESVVCVETKMKRPLVDRRPIMRLRKEPLDLPLIDNLGLDSDTSPEVGKLLFRGASLGSFNSDEFNNNEINGRTVNIWTFDTAAGVKRYNIDTQSRTGRHKTTYFTNGASNTELEQEIIDKFRIGHESVNEFGVDRGEKEVPIKYLKKNNLIARQTETEVTGGLSKTLGTSIRFAGYFEDATIVRNWVEGSPIVLFLEKNRIPARLVEVEYTNDFIENHPAIAGAVDKGSNMLMCPSLNEEFELEEHTARFSVSTTSKIQDLREDGELRLDVGNDDLVVLWFRDPLENFKSLDVESELFAYAGSIDLDSALLGMCMYVTHGKLSRLSQVESDNLEDMVEELHAKVQNNLKSYEDRLVMCVLNSRPKSSRNRILPSQFKLFYDGQNFTRDYAEAIPFTVPEQY